MFDNLSEKLKSVVLKSDTLTKDNIADALTEVRRALLEADVNISVVKAFIVKVKEKLEGEKVFEGVNPGQQTIKIIRDEIAELLGNDNVPLKLEGNPPLIMMLGLQGSGKTTACAKLSKFLQKEGKKPLMIAADLYRPAAILQLKTLGEQNNIPVFAIDGCTDVQKVIEEGISFAKENAFSPVIIDTAGRLQTDENMMAEVLIVDRKFNPCEKLLVIDSMAGQEAVNTARDFNEQIGITGTILTKVDGDARGGAALSVVYRTEKPVKFLSNGEKIEPLELFHPKRIADRILGMGDIVTLVEKAGEAFDEKHAKELEAKMKKAEFNFEDFLKMQKQMKMFGSIENLLGMLPIPGLNKEKRETIAEEGERQLKKIEVFVSSMTSEEKLNPQIINSSRKRRLSKGSGLPMQDVNMILTQFEQMRYMLKGFSDMKDKMKKGKLKIPKGMMPGFSRFVK